MSRLFKALFSVLAAVVGAILTLLFGSSGAETAKLRQQLRGATNYRDWRTVAKQLDELEGYTAWSTDEDTRLFHVDEITTRINNLTDMHRRGERTKLLNVIQTDLNRWTCGIHNADLYNYRTGTKAAIRTYVNLVRYLCKSLTDNEEVPAALKLEVFSDAARSYGNTALILNGNAALGAYHLGVVKALHEANVLPRIIYGRNTGAFVAAFIGCMSDFEKMWHPDSSKIFDFSAFDQRSEKGSLWRKLKRLSREGYLMDVTVIEKFLRDNLGDITFLEAYQKTGRVLNIYVEKVVGKRPASWVMNHLTAPNVLVYSAAARSCASLGLYAECSLKARAMDGEIVTYSPAPLRYADERSSWHINESMSTLRHLFNVSAFIVSDTSIANLPFLTIRQRSALPFQAVRFFTDEVIRFVAWFSSQYLPSRFAGEVARYAAPLRSDVSIFPAARLGDTVVLKNPNQQMIKYCISRGEQETWPKIERIRTMLTIEKALHEAINVLKEQTERSVSPYHFEV